MHSTKRLYRPGPKWGLNFINRQSLFLRCGGRIWSYLFEYFAYELPASRRAHAPAPLASPGRANAQADGPGGPNSATSTPTPAARHPPCAHPPGRLGGSQLICRDLSLPHWIRDLSLDPKFGVLADPSANYTSEETLQEMLELTAELCNEETSCCQRG